MSLRITLVSAGAFLSIMLMSHWCGEAASPTMPCQPITPTSDPAQVANEDRKPTAIKLPRTNLVAVTAGLSAPIGIASQNRPIFEKLENRRLSLDVCEVPIADVMDNLRDQVGCNILLDRAALQDEGITPDTPITAHLVDAPFGNGLNRLLEPFNLTYVVRHGVILITSQLESGNTLTFQVYPVGDLVWMGEPGGDQVVDFDPLIKLLEQTISSNSWSSAGGAGTIRAFMPSLSIAINQTRAVHEQIVKVLGSLRKALESTDQVERAGRTKQPLRPKVQLLDVGSSERELEIMRTARDLVICLDFEDLPLVDAVRFLIEYSRLPIDLDRPYLEEEGVTADTPVSMKVSGVTFDDALKLLLTSFNLTWTVKHDVIFITSQLHASNQVNTRCYPVGDLVLIRAGGARWSVFHTELQEMIENIISPNSWSSVGGAGTLRYFPASQCLIISQTQAVHEQIGALLAALRESTDRFFEITQMAGMPTPEELAEVQLRAVRATGLR